MRQTFIAALAFGCTLFTCQSAGFADRVVEYVPGMDPVPGFDNANSALGQPTQVNPFGDDVTPFNPPYSPENIVSLGVGGSLTLQFQTPVLNHPNNPFGIDFIIFGNSGFIVTNEFDLETFQWIGIPATDGSLFGANDGETRISVSRDGHEFFILDPTLAPTADRMLPTDGFGDFHTPAIPGLTQEYFAGLTESELAILYDGSAGGSGYDIAWARDSNSRSIKLQQIRFVRIEVLSGRSEIAAVSTVFAPPGLTRK